MRTALLSVFAVLVAVSAAVWLSTAGPLGTQNAADGSGARTSPAVSLIASSASIAPATTAAPSPTRTSASPSPSPTPSKKASTAAASSSSGPTAASSGTHLITIVNADNETIWAATNPNTQHPIPVTGWKLAPGQSVSFTVPDGWGGRVWGRTGCSFNSSGVGHCQTGDCGGLFQCQGSEGGTTTLAELTLDSFDGMDFYDVSMVDGANLPMYINTTHRTAADPISSNGCYEGACTKAVVCPSGMQVKSNGQAVACETACAAFGGDAYCCTGSWSGRANCDPAKWPVDYAKLVFKDAEPYAYSYAFDDSATMACKGHCNYRITFGITP
ncbi:thaumatin family protein [Actinospica sp.]|uniref:thaumatin family protein n=1 Tax=Actinospica sp. TaxID=1872142 RepID=UPI002C39D5A1|nr:thaumatin family protein [Actinospica sp.]HWG24293.1 thaumatin family protein [Actinospica sp.]